MKRVIIAIGLLVSSTVYGQTANSFKTSEYYRSRALDSVKAADAWARGYTGKGVTIAILDSGINSTSNVEFLGRIKLTRDFTGQNNIIDTIGHGTHVAGIAAAGRNSNGMVGVAPDANLIIGKITTTGVTTGNIIVQAINWASVNNAKVINLSFNSTLNSTAINAKLIAPGVYSTRFTNSGSIPTINPYTYADAMKVGDSVLVIAAGNDSTPWSGTYSQLATATDRNGNLIMGGKVIVAGNWNSQTNTSTGPGNNGAAHLCQYMVGTVCQDKYQMWQFYLLAPGTGITSTGIGSTGLSTMTGTSMAAPTVSGAAAIVRQMWPQLNAAKTVQILLVTANKNIPGYNKYVHGQGLLDLEMATRPVGTVAVPTGTSLGQSTISVSTLLITGGSAGTAGASSLMLVDDFDRDFYLPGKNLTAHYTPEQADIVQVSLPYFTGNAYTQFNQYNDYVSIKNGSAASTWYFNSGNNQNSSPAMGEVSYKTNTVYGDVKFTAGLMVERGAWLGNYLNGFDGQRSNKDSVTQYLGVGFEKEFDAVKIAVSVTNGVTSTDSQSSNIKNIGPILSYSWNASVETDLNKDLSLGVMAYQPVSVYHAEADLDAPVGLTEDFEIIRNSKANLAADVRELRTGVYLKLNNRRDVNLLTFAEYRKDFRGQEGKNDLAVGIVLTKKF